MSCSCQDAETGSGRASPLEEIIAGAREQARANEEKAEKAAGERKREVLAAAEAHRAEAIRAVMETVI